MSIRINGDNTTAAPGITGADSDTGLQCGTDELKLVTGGTERVNINSAGFLKVKDPTGSDNIQLAHDGSNGSLTNTGGDLLLYATGTQSLICHTGALPRLRILSNGTIQLANSPGIDFSQIQTNAGGMSSETLDSYEEGVWTPSAYPSGGTINSFYGQSGRYVKIGRIVHAKFAVHINIASTAPSSVGAYLYVGGLPFVASNTWVSTGQAREQSVVGFMYNVNLAANATTFVLHRESNAGVIVDGGNYHGSIVYEVA